MKISVADIIFGIDGISGLTAERYRDFRVPEDMSADFDGVALTDDEITRAKSLDGVVTYADAEAAALRRKIADLLTLKGKTVFHGAAFEYNSKGYIFTGPSGVGKSTQLKNWVKLYGNKVRIINGDKPAVGEKNGKLYIYPTPWNGKEGFCTSEGATFDGIIFLEQAKTDEIVKISDGEKLLAVYLQCFGGGNTKEERLCAVRMTDRICDIPSVKLRNLGMENSATMLKEYIDKNGGTL